MDGATFFWMGYVRHYSLWLESNYGVALFSQHYGRFTCCDKCAVLSNCSDWITIWHNIILTWVGYQKRNVYTIYQRHNGARTIMAILLKGLISARNLAKGRWRKCAGSTMFVLAVRPSKLLMQANGYMPFWFCGVSLLWGGDSEFVTV